MIDVVEYVCRSTPNVTSLNTVNERKGRSTLYHIIENDFATTVANTGSIVTAESFLLPFLSLCKRSAMSFSVVHVMGQKEVEKTTV